MFKQAMNNNKLKFWFLFSILYVAQTQCKVVNRRDDDNEDAKNEGKCWIKLQEKSFFEEMDALDEKYKAVREAFSKEVDTKHFDDRMLAAMTKTRGVAERTLQKFRGNPNIIPAGLNLGSYCMMRMPGSMLFFYRLKLRNDTHFTVNYIHNDVDQLTLTLRLSLNDLHLLGQYERALTSSEDPSRLYYRPNNGEVEFLLKDVKYKVEGRYRLLDDRLHIEHILSQIPPMEILMRYTTDPAGSSIPIDPNSLKDYLDRMQTDLDYWLKDYFNDFLMLYGFEEAQKNVKFQQYENERTMKLNKYADKVIDILNDRVRSLGTNLMMPNMVLTAVNGMEIKLYDGSVRGFDSMYRRSEATGKRANPVRYLDADIGFSGLKAEYRYDTYVKTGLPPVSGVFVLNADDISAHMSLQVVNYSPATADLQVTFLKHGKPETLTIEGPANRIVANFNHLLEHHIITIMSTNLIHHLRSLSSLTKCDPQLPTKEGGNEANEPTDDNPEDDFTTPMSPIDSSNTEPENENEVTEESNIEDEPTVPSPYTEDDGPTAPPSSKEDEPTEPPSGNEDKTSTPDDDMPTTSDDDMPTTPDDDMPTTPDDDMPTTPDDDMPSTPDDDMPTTPDDDMPTTPDDDMPTPSDDDMPTTPDDDIPTTPDDDMPTTPDDDMPTPSDDDIPSTPDDDMPTTSDDDVPTLPVDDGPTEPSQYPDPSNSQENNANETKPDFGFARKESIEIELPPKPGSFVKKGESYKIDHNETFTMTKLKHPHLNSFSKLNDQQKTELLSPNYY